MMSTTKSKQATTRSGILKSGSIIALGTLSSRILGFVRDIILAKLLGTGFQADAFFVAFRIPNLFRNIVGEGSVNATIVPVLSEYATKKDKTELWNLISVIFISSTILLSFITIIGMIFAPIIVRIIAPGFIVNAEKLDLTIKLTRIMFPYLIFIGLTAYSIGILYTHRSFIVPAFTPCLLNIIIIITAIIASRNMQEPVLGLAVGILLGGIAQLLVQLRPLAKNNIKFVRPKTFMHPGAKKVGRLFLPRLFGTAVYQLNIFIDTFCASLSVVVGAGGISAIYYANRIIQFPLGVFSIALASAILPTLSEFSAKNQSVDFKKTLIFSLQNIFLIMVPVSIVIVFLATSIIRVLFERGEFTAYSTSITSSALLFYALGLVSFSGIKIMVTAFHSQQNTMTPARIAGVSLLINVILNFLLMKPFKIGGIALASSIAATVNFSLLLYVMNKKIKGIGLSVTRHIAKLFMAALIMIVFMLWLKQYISSYNEIFSIAAMSISSIIIFFVACLLLKIEQTKEMIRWILKIK